MRPSESGEHEFVYQFSVSCFVNGWGRGRYRLTTDWGLSEIKKMD
jgi:hypothetical protein